MTDLKTRIQQAITNQGSDPANLAQLAVDAIEAHLSTCHATEALAEFHAKGGKTLAQVKAETDQPKANGFDEWFSHKYRGDTFFKGREFVISELEAAYTAGQARVEVKPLEWEAKIAHPKAYHDSGGWTRHANTPLSMYIINHFKSGKPLYLVEYRGKNISKGEKIKNEEAAKAAAQAHHEAAVRSMIVGA